MYQIQINEAQRSLLEMALRTLAVSTGATINTNEELILMVGMIEELPKVEAASPGILHCFNL